MRVIIGAAAAFMSFGDMALAGYEMIPEWYEIHGPAVVSMAMRRDTTTNDIWQCNATIQFDLVKYTAKLTSGYCTATTYGTHQPFWFTQNRFKKYLFSGDHSTPTPNKPGLSIWTLDDDGSVRYCATPPASTANFFAVRIACFDVPFVAK